MPGEPAGRPSCALGSRPLLPSPLIWRGAYALAWRSDRHGPTLGQDEWALLNYP